MTRPEIADNVYEVEIKIYSTPDRKATSETLRVSGLLFPYIVKKFVRRVEVLSTICDIHRASITYSCIYERNQNEV